MAEFLEAVQVGAGLRDMAFKRQERQQALKSQEALRQIQERQLAAQAQMLTEHAMLYREQAQAAQAARMDEQALVMASRDLHDKFVAEGVDEETATGKTLAVMAARYPAQAQKLAAAYASVKRGEMADEARPLDPSQVAANEARATASLAQAELATKRAAGETTREQRLMAQEERLAAKEARISERFNLTEADRVKVSTMSEQIKALHKERLALDPDKAGNKSKRFKLAMEAGRLMKQIDQLAEKRGAKAPTVEGGGAQRRVRSPDGTLGWVPEEDLEDAIAEGYELIEEGR